MPLLSPSDYNDDKLTFMDFRSGNDRHACKSDEQIRGMENTFSRLGLQSAGFSSMTLHFKCLITHLSEIAIRTQKQMSICMLSFVLVSLQIFFKL